MAQFNEYGKNISEFILTGYVSAAKKTAQAA
jgi:hypothetical protein